jgi:hypothetical protein
MAKTKRRNSLCPQNGQEKRKIKIWILTLRCYKNCAFEYNKTKNKVITKNVLISLLKKSHGGPKIKNATSF